MNGEIMGEMLGEMNGEPRGQTVCGQDAPHLERKDDQAVTACTRLPNS